MAVHLTHSSPFCSFRSLPIFIFLFLILAMFCGTTQKTTNGAETEMGQHELEEGSGDMFNPDDEDDLEASGMAPPAEETEEHPTLISRPAAVSPSLLQNVSISHHHSLTDHISAAPKHPQQTLTTPAPGGDGPRVSVSPTTPPPFSSFGDGTEDKEEDRLKQHFHLALLFSLVVLITTVGFGSVALYCCYQRRRRRRTRQNRSEEYSAGREQSRHYL